MSHETSHLDSRLEAMKTAGGFPAETVDRFGAYIADAPDGSLHRASPLVYAAQAGIGEAEAIDLFLHATHAGVLEFSWGILCPACTSFLTTPGGLRAHPHPGSPSGSRRAVHARTALQRVSSRKSSG